MRHRPRGSRRFAGAALSLWSDPSTAARPAFASHGACGAALRGGSAALPPHPLAQSPSRPNRCERLPAVRYCSRPAVRRRVLLDSDVHGVFAVMPTPSVQTMVTVLPMPVQTMNLMMVPMMVTSAGIPMMRLGASLRDRATLPSPLRGLGPSGGYPSRLRSLRSLRAPLARRLASLAAACRPDTLAATFDRIACVTAVSSSRRRFAARSSQPSPRSPFAGCAGCGQRLGLVPARPVRRRCALRAAPDSAPRRALRSASVRAAPPPPPAACCAPLPAAPSAPPSAHAPRRLRRAALASADSPFAHAARWPFPTARGRPRFSHPTHR